MHGRRRETNCQGFYVHPPHPGDYGRLEITLEQVRGFVEQLWWNVWAPDGSSCSLNPEIHTVTEHQDGTITVTLSIVTSTWHGWLERGDWRSV